MEMSPVEPMISDRKAPRRRRITLGQLIDDFIVLASGQFLSKIFGFLAFAWLARQLTVEDYGAVETAVGMAAIGAIALEMGTGAVGVRRIAQGESSAATVLGSVIAGRMALAVLAAPALALFYITLTKSTAPDLLFWLFAASLFAVPFNHNWFFQSREKMGVAGFGQTLKMGAFLVAALVLAPQSNGVTYVAVAEIIAATAMAFWFSGFAFYAIRPERPLYSLASSGKLLRESAQLGASSFVNALAQYLPILVVASVANDIETAQFGASQRLILSLMTFSYVYYFNLYPLIARKIVEDAEALQRIIAASVRVTAWAGVIMAVLLWTLAPLIMRLIFGRSFEAAAPEFGILAWSSAIILASGNARWLLVASKRQGALLAAHLVNATCVVGLGYAFASFGGGAGAAAACIVGALGLWAVAHWRTAGLVVRPGLAGNLPAVAVAAAIVIALTLIDLGGLGPVIAILMLAVGLLCDRQLPIAIEALVKAKAAT